MEPEPTFETALDQLEQIADDLERGESDLTVALAKYEQAVRLLKHCYGQLDAAERTVALLTDVDPAGQPITAPFDATATTERDPAPTTEATPTPKPKRSRTASSTKITQLPTEDNDDSSVPF